MGCFKPREDPWWLPWLVKNIDDWLVVVGGAGGRLGGRWCCCQHTTAAHRTARKQ